jgi:hypothetical protein
LIEKCHSEEFVQARLAILMAVFSRFVDREQIWKRLFALLFCDPKFEFGKGIKTVALHMLGLVLRLLVPLVRLENQQFVAKIWTTLTDAILPRYPLLCDRTTVLSFFYFLKKGDLTWSAVLPEIQEDEFFPAKARLAAVFSQFLEKYRTKFGGPPGEDYPVFVTTFLSALLMASRVNPKCFSVFLLNIENVDIGIHALVQFLNEIRGNLILRECLESLSESLVRVAVRSNDPAVVEALANALHAFCFSDKTVPLCEFLRFWWAAYPSMRLEHQIRILEEFRLELDQLPLRSMSDFYPFLFLVSRLAPDSLRAHPFPEVLWRRFAACLGQSEDRRLLRYQTLRDFFRSEDFEPACATFKHEYDKRLQEAVFRSGSDTTSRTPGQLISFLFSVAYQNCVTLLLVLKWFLRSLNQHHRSIELTWSRLLSHRTKWNFVRNTVRLAPAHSPGACPLILTGSPFGIADAKTTAGRISDWFGVQRHRTYDWIAESPSLLVEMFLFSGYFYVDSLVPYFRSRFGEDGQLINCKLMRRALAIPCVCAVYPAHICFLGNARCEADDISLFEQKDMLFLESVFLGEFGAYRLFCGHAVLIMPLSSLTFVRSTEHECSLNSLSIGSVFLTFEGFVPDVLTEHKPAVKRLLHEWLTNAMSDCEYLIWLNLLSGRSFDALSSYPIFPRVMRSFTSETFDGDRATLRDLAVPLPVLCDREPDHGTRMGRMGLQGYHHSENVSNPVGASGFLIRIIPFFNFQSMVHDGFDMFERIFVSVPQFFSFSRISMWEFGPEHFLCPEMYQNLNRLVHPNGRALDVTLPLWARDAFDFVDRHRYVIESAPVRSKLNGWIDLMFGFKQRGDEAVAAMNLFHPMGYSGSELNVEQQMLRQNWILSCGGIPDQLFDEPDPECKPRPGGRA